MKNVRNIKNGIASGWFRNLLKREGFSVALDDFFGFLFFVVVLFTINYIVFVFNIICNYLHNSTFSI